jgi:hypothetical protein
VTVLAIQSKSPAAAQISLLQSRIRVVVRPRRKRERRTGFPPRTGAARPRQSPFLPDGQRCPWLPRRRLKFVGLFCQEMIGAGALTKRAQSHAASVRLNSSRTRFALPTIALRLAIRYAAAQGA